MCVWAQAQGCGLGWGLPRGGRGSSSQAGGGRHDQVRVGGWIRVLLLASWWYGVGRAGGDLLILDALISISPARERVSGDRWAPRFLPPKRGAWSWTPGSGGRALTPSRPRARGWGLSPEPEGSSSCSSSLPSFLPCFASSFHFPRGPQGRRARGGEGAVWALIVGRTRRVRVAAPGWRGAEGPRRAGVGPAGSGRRRW